MVVLSPPSPRPMRGSRLANFYPPVPEQGPSLSSLDSAFQLQEYISMLIRHNPHDVETIVALPTKVKVSGGGEDKQGQSEGADKEGKNEVVVDEACWIYEQLRRLAQDLSHPLITSLQQECTRASCPEMKAGEWLYLCVAHGNDGSMEHCCAIDYIIHTLDSATALLNSPRAFPSRLSIPSASLRHFSSLARRLGRIFAHAYFHHREAFENAEAESSLYARFITLATRFDLVPAEFLVIPPRMTQLAGSPTSERDRTGAREEAQPPRLQAAGVDQRHEREEVSQQEPSGVPPPSGQIELQPDRRDVIDLSVPRAAERAWSPEKPDIAAQTSSPRRLGRNRTDTMVLSDAAAFSEELREAAAAGGSGLGISVGGGNGTSERGHEVVEDASAEEESRERDVGDEVPEDKEEFPRLGAPAGVDVVAPGGGAAALTSASSAAAEQQPAPADDTKLPVPDAPSTDKTSASTEPEPQAQDEESSLTSGLPRMQGLIVLGESDEVCRTTDGNAHDEHDGTFADQVVPEQAPSRPSDKADQYSVLLEGSGEVGPGGFILIGEPGFACSLDSGASADTCGNAEEKNETENVSETKTQDAAAQSEAASTSTHKADDAGAAAAVANELSAEAPAEPKIDVRDIGPVLSKKGSEGDGKGEVEDEEYDDVQLESATAEVLMHVDPNITLDGDLEDVEKVLKE